MKRNTAICDKCNKEISLSNYNRHYKSCKGIIKEHLHIEEIWKQENGMYRCPKCNKEYSKNGISSHIIYKHIKPSGFKIYSENIKNGKIKHWAKGLTKETSEIIKNIADIRIKKYKSGELTPAFRGKKHTKKSRKIMSRKMILAIKEGRHPGWSSRKNKSYAEKYFETILINEGLSFESEYHLYNKNVNYFLDFYFSDKQIDLEIDGDQHKYRQESDKRRDTYLTSLGIKIFRIEWRNPKTKEGREYIINKINEFLKLIK